MRLLVIGGTVVVGRHLVDAAASDPSTAAATLMPQLERELLDAWHAHQTGPLSGR